MYLSHLATLSQKTYLPDTLQTYSNMSSKLPPLNKVSSQRLPPPALFQGPPSHNASNPSLTQTPSTAASRGPSQRPPLQRNRSSHTNGLAESSVSSHLAPSQSRTPQQRKGETDGSEAIWQEMQSALSEVELSAVSGDHVFGEKHSRALEDLRVKQLTLAQAWARNEAEDDAADPKSPDEPNPKSDPSSPKRPAAEQDEHAAAAAAAENVSYKSLDEETEKDILLARERREANDRYFDRVNNGVLDVVAKLEEVAQAMRAVQKESRDIWSESDSMSTSEHSTNPG
jgi:septum formation topological specificity factor MinE